MNWFQKVFTKSGMVDCQLIKDQIVSEESVGGVTPRSRELRRLFILNNCSAILSGLDGNADNIDMGSPEMSHPQNQIEYNQYII